MSETSSEDNFGWVTTSVSSDSRTESPEKDNIGPNGYDSDSIMHSKKDIKNESGIELETPKSSRKRKFKNESDDETPKRRKENNLDVSVKIEKSTEISPQEHHNNQDKHSFMSDGSDKIHKKKLKKKKKRKHSDATDTEAERTNSEFDQSNVVFKTEKIDEFNNTQEIKNEPSNIESDFQEYSVTNDKYSDLSNMKHNDSLMTDSSDQTHVKKKKKKKHRKHSPVDYADDTKSNPEIDQSNSQEELNMSVNNDSTTEKKKISKHSINSDVSETEIKSPKVSKKKNKKKSKEKSSDDEDTPDVKEISVISKPKKNLIKSFLGSPMLNGNVSEDSITSGAHTSVKTEATPKANKVRFDNDDDWNNIIISNFLQANPNLNFIKNKKNRVMITDNDEIWQLKIPVDIDVSNLKNNNLTIKNNKCKIKVNNETYIGKLDNENSSVNAMFNENDNYVVKNIKVLGTVQLHKRIPKSHITLDNLVEDENGLIPLPETKRRHPLFGSSYKEAMKLPSPIQQKLKQVLSEPQEESKKKKRKKNENNAEDNVIEESFKKKKKKKRKLSENEDDQVPRKKSKCNFNSSEALEKAIEENLFN